MFRNVEKLSFVFQKQASLLLKKASISSDLAIRIMHSLVPYATEDATEASHAQALLVTKHLLGVAERYVQRACRLIVDEITYSKNNNVKLRVRNFFASKRYLDLAKVALKDFEDPESWSEAFGGQVWAKYTNGVINLYLAIDKIKSAIEENNVEDINKYSGFVSVYMNYLDGLSHNTGNFIEKGIGLESEESSFIRNLRNANTLMDAKQLSNKEDVLPYIRDYIYGNPDAYLYKDYFVKLVNSLNRPDLNRAEKELIGQKKNCQKLGIEKD